jgi:hypothetical protein
MRAPARAQRRIGELIDDDREAGTLAKGTRAQGRPAKGGVRKTPPKDTPTLASQGVDKELAKRARQRAIC